MVFCSMLFWMQAGPESRYSLMSVLADSNRHVKADGPAQLCCRAQQRVVVPAGTDVQSTIVTSALLVRGLSAFRPAAVFHGPSEPFKSRQALALAIPCPFRVGTRRLQPSILAQRCIPGILRVSGVHPLHSSDRSLAVGWGPGSGGPSRQRLMSFSSGFLVVISQTSIADPYHSHPLDAILPSTRVAS
jgi:hypothetical protein